MDGCVVLTMMMIDNDEQREDLGICVMVMNKASGLNNIIEKGLIDQHVF